MGRQKQWKFIYNKSVLNLQCLLFVRDTCRYINVLCLTDCLNILFYCAISTTHETISIMLKDNVIIITIAIVIMAKISIFRFLPLRVSVICVCAALRSAACRPPPVVWLLPKIHWTTTATVSCFIIVLLNLSTLIQLKWLRLFLYILARKFNCIITKPKVSAKCSTGFIYYATLLIRNVTGLARPSVHPSVRLSVRPSVRLSKARSL